MTPSDLPIGRLRIQHEDRIQSATCFVADLGDGGLAIATNAHAVSGAAGVSLVSVETGSGEFSAPVDLPLKLVRTFADEKPDLCFLSADTAVEVVLEMGVRPENLAIKLLDARSPRSRGTFEYYGYERTDLGYQLQRFEGDFPEDFDGAAPRALDLADHQEILIRTSPSPGCSGSPVFECDTEGDATFLGILSSRCTLLEHPSNTDWGSVVSVSAVRSAIRSAA